MAAIAFSAPTIVAAKGHHRRWQKAPRARGLPRGVLPPVRSHRRLPPGAWMPRVRGNVGAHQMKHMIGGVGCERSVPQVAAQTRVDHRSTNGTGSIL